jgi:hypothetical protein
MFRHQNLQTPTMDALPVEIGLVVWAYAGAFLTMYLAVFAGAGY